MGVNTRIGRLAATFVVIFAALALRAFWVQIVAAPALLADPHDPRMQLAAGDRGAILARDGTPLAHSGARGRVYPYGTSFAHAVGYVSTRYGTSGLERAFDAQLAGRWEASDPIAQARVLFGHAPSPATVRGSDVVTTLDVATQLALAQALAPFPRAAGVALDPRTGEVLALASVPSFNPATLDRDFPALRASSASPLLDRALDGLYPPGSTFKIFTAAAALDSSVVVPDDSFVDNGSLRVGNFVVHDDESEATGTQDLAGAFALSSNVDFASIALRMGVARWFAYADRWQLGTSVDFTLPAQVDHLPERASVTPSILAQLGFGQADLLVTPLRVALLAATVADGGIEPQPFLVRAIRSTGGAISAEGARAPLATPISAATASEVKTLMLAVVERGTGTAAQLPGVAVAGKTGTATNPAGRAHAWFVAFAPAPAPRVVVAIVVENAGYGGVVAAPIARRVLAVALNRR